MVELSSNREAQSKVEVIVVCVCYFLQNNRKTNEFVVLQEAKLGSHGTTHVYRCARPTCHPRSSREQNVLVVSRIDDERLTSSCKKDS